VSRPLHRAQRADPTEPHVAHELSNCTMASGATAYAFHVDAPDDPLPGGGTLRHRQNDQVGGTGLDDLAVAWERYGGQRLRILSGTGWAGVRAALAEHRYVVVQGTGRAPGASGTTADHAIAIGARVLSGGRWRMLISDPWYTRWQWVDEADVIAWARRLSRGIRFATTRPHPPIDPTPPTPEQPPTPEGPPVQWATATWSGGSWT
jgi:hypothetical protein